MRKIAITTQDGSVWVMHTATDIPSSDVDLFVADQLGKMPAETRAQVASWKKAHDEDFPADWSKRRGWVHKGGRIELDADKLEKRKP